VTDPTQIPGFDLELESLPPVADVEALLRTFSKTLRAFQMYQSNNPIFKRFESALEDQLAAIWQQTDALELTVREDGFGYGDEVIAVGEGRESLAYPFYRDGIRYLVFRTGFEREAAAFLEVVRRAGGRGHESEDLVSALWEKDFESLRYGYVDLLAEGIVLPDADPAAAPGLGVSPLEADAAADREAARADAAEAASAGALVAGLTREDFDDTLYFLDPGELSVLQTEVEIEMERDVRRGVLSALFDRLEEPDQPKRQLEIMEILDQLIPLFLSRGHMGSAALVLEELDRLAATRASAIPELGERIETLFRRLGDPEVMEQFVQALEDGAVAPESEDVTLFFSRLQAGALSVLLRFAEVSESSAVRDRLAAAVDGLAARYPGEIDALLRSSEPVLVKGAARAAGRAGLGQCVRGLQAALSHPDGTVRLAAVEGLVAIRLTPALLALIPALEDPDREVRVAAARALGAVRFASARDALGAALDGRRLKEADLTEKRVFYEAYGAVGGKAAVDRLGAVLNDRRLLGRRAPSELRACAALGLAQVGSPAAREQLERSEKDDDPVVRNAVLKALRQEVEVSP
jgi:hypothetical protein